MTPHVLGVGYSYNEYSVTAQVWKEYGIEFDYVESNISLSLYKKNGLYDQKAGLLRLPSVK